MEPCQVSIRTPEMIKLRLLADPENSQSQKAHQINGQLRKERRHGMKQLAFGVNCLPCGRVQFQQKQSHGDRKNAVAQSRKAFRALSCNLVVAGWHRHRSLISIRQGREFISLRASAEGLREQAGTGFDEVDA